MRAKMWDAGFRPVALYNWNDAAIPVRDRGKRPFGNAWEGRALQTPPEAANAAPHARALNTGLLLNGLRAVDVDVDDPNTAARIRALGLAMLGDAPIRTRTGTNRCALLYRAAVGEPVKVKRTGSLGTIEVLGRGQQLHVHGPHPSGAALAWHPEAPGWFGLDELPTVTEPEVAAFLNAAAPLLGFVVEPSKDRSGRPQGAKADALLVVAALAVIPNTGPADWDAWNRLGMATWAATDGSEAGRLAFTAWSEKHPEHDPVDCANRWDGYAASPPSRIGAGTLFHLANLARPGWRNAIGGGCLKRDRKRPLFRALPPAPDFPMLALGELRLAAEAVQDHTRAPAAVCAQSVLAAVTLAVQAHYDVVLPSGSDPKPLTGLFVSVLDSGERKSAVDRLAVRAAYKVEAGFREAAQEAAATYADAKEVWEHARAHAKKAVKSDRMKLASAFRDIGPAPTPPPHPMLLVADPTPEALVMHLTARPWGGLFTAEGGLFVGGSAMNDETRMRTGALLNTLWDGGPIRRLRVGTGATFLPGRRCSAHIMVQPAIASRLFADATLDGIGTLARTLLVAPAGTAGTRMFRAPSAIAAAALVDYDARLTGLMTRPPRTTADMTILDPLPLTLTPDATAMWIAFHDAVEGDQAPESHLRPIRAFASKMAEHAGRLAAVLTVYADPNAADVEAEAMAGGIALAQHYAAELLRLYGAAGIAPDLDLAARLLAWWQSRPDPRCHLATIYQRSVNAIRDAATARRIVAVLEEHGHVDRLPTGIELEGKPRSEAWELVS